MGRSGNTSLTHSAPRNAARSASFFIVEAFHVSASPSGAAWTISALWNTSSVRSLRSAACAAHCKAAFEGESTRHTRQRSVVWGTWTCTSTPQLILLIVVDCRHEGTFTFTGRRRFTGGHLCRRCSSPAESCLRTDRSRTCGSSVCSTTDEYPHASVRLMLHLGRHRRHQTWFSPLSLHAH